MQSFSSFEHNVELRQLHGASTKIDERSTGTCFCPGLLIHLPCQAPIYVCASRLTFANGLPLCVVFIIRLLLCCAAFC